LNKRGLLLIMRNSKLALAIILGLSITAITGGSISSVSLNLNSSTNGNGEGNGENDLDYIVSDEIILWPPNHKFHTINVCDYVEITADGTEVDVGKENIVITSVSSDEPENAKKGDGNTPDDIIIVDPQTVNLRAESLGNGNGRVYTINFDIIVDSEIIASESLQVMVPHDKGKGEIAIDSGPVVEYSYIFLYEKVPSGEWPIVEDGAWGFLQYTTLGPEFKYFLNAKGLEEQVLEYNLIYYADPWPGNHTGALIDSVWSDSKGNITKSGSINLNMDLPHPNDKNYHLEEEGAKIWLVLSNDYDPDKNAMIDWNPEKYLFENNLITYDDTDVAYLLLYEKVPSGEWPIVEDGAWGNLKYNHEGPEFEYEFYGFGLEPGSYSLIYYADPWPGNHLGAFIASGSTDVLGDIYLSGTINLDMDLPHPNDDNYQKVPKGAKIWLVKSADYDADAYSMIGWNPTEYLFENNLIIYDDTDAADPI
jgi:hypothetical protein